MSTTTATDRERVQSSGSKEKMADAIAKYIDIEKEVDSSIAQMMEKREEIIRVIERLPFDEYDVLHKRYVQSKSPKEIALARRKSTRWVGLMRQKGLHSVQKILDENISEKG